MTTPRPVQGMQATIYLLPNLITAASLFCGLLAIKLSIDGRIANVGPAHHAFALAAYAIIFAAFCDGLDGSVARLTRTQSSFGVQLDSLCDCVSFGAAPAIVVYNFCLFGLGRIGLAVCFLFMICGALRLARFNVQASKGRTNGNFTGIPIPMAAVPVAVCILAYQDLLELGKKISSGVGSSGHLNPALGNSLNTSLLTEDSPVSLKSILGSEFFEPLAQWVSIPAVRDIFFASTLVFLAFGMISTFEYVSTKSMKFSAKHPFRLLAIVLTLIVILFSFEVTLSLAFLMILYCLHGPFLWLFFKRDKAQEDAELFHSTSEDENK
jgi:CDP-diacylglycerol---serine O-phosphatidyltransferase